MTSNRVIILPLAVAILILAGCQAPPRNDGPSLGGLEHRGRRYDLRDLTSPEYRADSRDPFARDFKIDTCWARKDASVGMK